MEIFYFEKNDKFIVWLESVHDRFILYKKNMWICEDSKFPNMK